jgi:hypothetical protein
MRPFQSLELYRQLAARGWRYDPAIQEFYDGKRLLEWEDVIKLVPGMTVDDLAAWEASLQSRLREQSELRQQPVPKWRLAPK